MLYIRTAKVSDLDKILKIYEAARSFMASVGNPSQWSDSYPPKELLVEDIASEKLYCVESEGVVEGVFYFSVENDPTYAEIDGKWLDDEPYAVIHRVASSGRVKGVLSSAVRFATDIFPNIKIDTHNDNLVMQAALSKLGFEKCGTIRLENGDPRIAYQLVVNK